MSEERILKAIAIISDAFESLGLVSTELKALIGEITETGVVEHITDKEGRLLARLFKREGILTVLPVEHLGIPVDGGAIKTFLIDKVLEGIKRAHGLNYFVESSPEGLLRSIRLEGVITDKIQDDLKEPVKWAFSHVLEPSAPPAPKKTLEGIFPKELADLLTFEEKPDAVLIKPKGYLGSENFAKIVAVVKDHGGQYVSAGKNSHFKLPKVG